MLRIDPVVEPSRPAYRRLIVYVEGPQDRAILKAWAYRLLPALGSRLFGASVILGGRRPKRAVDHFRGAGGLDAGLAGICVLDRDHENEPPSADSGVPGLELFTWGRRHIESYLLIPAAIQRSLSMIPDGDRRICRSIEAALPGSADEAAYSRIDAKRLPTDFRPAGGARHPRGRTAPRCAPTLRPAARAVGDFASARLKSVPP